jgi:hypothetical protein
MFFDRGQTGKGGASISLLAIDGAEEIAAGRIGAAAGCRDEPWSVCRWPAVLSVV